MSIREGIPEDTFPQFHQFPQPITTVYYMYIIRILAADKSLYYKELERDRGADSSIWGADSSTFCKSLYYKELRIGNCKNRGADSSNTF
jgi:hypothetical protein